MNDSDTEFIANEDIVIDSSSNKDGNIQYIAPYRTDRRSKCRFYLPFLFRLKNVVVSVLRVFYSR